MRSSIINFLSGIGPTEPGAKNAIYTGLAILLSQWLIALWFYGQLPPQIPFFYSLPSGQLQLAGRQWFLIVPAISTTTLLLNLILIRLKTGLKIYQQLISWLTVLSLFIVLVSLIHTLILVL